MFPLIGRLAAQRFFDDEIIDDVVFAPGSPGEIDQRVLVNSAEQMMLAPMLWPFAVTILAAVTVIVTGAAFGVARLAFWIGSQISPAPRAFGFAASFYLTALATDWAFWRMLT